MTRAFSPRTLAEAQEFLARGATKVAGATDLMVADRVSGREHAWILNVLGIAELRGIHVDETGLNIGAASTFAEVRRSADVALHALALIEAAATIGAAQIQNRATIGGNIANASPAGDSLPALLALDAQIVLAGPQGRRTVPYETFHIRYRKTVLEAEELIERVVIPLPAPKVQAFRKVGTRTAQAISKVVIGLGANRRGDMLRNVRLAMGGVAETPIRLRQVEAIIESEPLSRELADAAAAVVENTISPIDDVRSTASYRRHVAGQLVRRLLLDLLRGF